MDCWNCDGKMKKIRHDAQYNYFECPTCGKERAILREDRPRYEIGGLNSLNGSNSLNGGSNE